MAAPQDILEKRIQANISLCKKSNGVKINLERAAQNIVDLQRGLTGKRDLVGNAYMQKAASLQAYLLYYWPVTYAQTSAALKKCQGFFESVQKIKERPIRILDLGSGPAPASCAVADMAQGRGEQSLKFEFTLCDSSGDALSLGKRILENAYPKSGKAETVVCNFEKNFSVDKKFDFIIASHSLNELWKNEKKRGQKLFDFVKKVCERLEDDGLLILMEPALLATSRALIELRDSIIGSGMNLVSP
ncbi:MAG: small ribosomal subunit Rsm22 family protein, partial [Treponema sp.]|nr:small ribosomal subunit Rsm22 family protein [Treponema sp.]